MSGKNIDFKSLAITAATATGYVTISSTTGWYKGATVWIKNSAATIAKECFITEVASSTVLGILFKEERKVYGRSDVSSFNGGVLTQLEQLLYNTDEASGGGSLSSGVSSFNSRTGAVVPQAGDYSAVDVGAEPVGTAASAVSTHVGLSDPHTQYQKESERDAANGYAGLDASTKLALSQLPVIDDTVHGTRGGGTLHAIATQSVAGFMSSADKTRFDNTGSNILTFKPGGTNGNGVVTTWAQVQAVAAAAEGPWTLYIDDSLAAAEVPAATTTDFKMLCTIDIVFGQSNGKLTIKDTGVIKNFLNLQTGGVYVEAATTAGIIFDTPGLRTNIREGGVIQNTLGVSTVPAINVTVDFYVIVSFQSGAITNIETSGEPTVPMLEYTSTNSPFFVIAQIANTRAGATVIPANCIVGDASATILNIHDAGDRLTPQSGFLGAISYVPIALSQYLAPAQGDTASRTSFATAGAMYFDTTLGIPIWYNGTSWIDATGTIV